MLDLRVQYGKDTVTILEFDDGNRYEVVRWTEDEIDQLGDELLQIVENTKEMVESNPEKIIEILYGSIESWNQKRDARKWD
jgi:hypothetical protein